MLLSFSLIKSEPKSSKDNPTFFYDAYLGIYMYVTAMRNIDPNKNHEVLQPILHAQLMDNLYPMMMQILFTQLVVAAGFGGAEHTNFVITTFNNIHNDRGYLSMTRKYSVIFTFIRAFYQR